MPMRILHAPRNVADQAGAITRALRRLGHEAELWEYDASPHGYSADRTIDTRSGDPAIWWRTFLEATERFDIVHFHFGRSFFPESWAGMPPLWDVPLYRALGRKMYMTFHGSDARLQRVHLEVNPWSHYATSDVRADDDRTEKAIHVFRTYAEAMFVVSPSLLHFVPDAVVLPRVIDLEGWPDQPAHQRDVPILLHVPSRRGTKGTERIVAGVERLREEGLRFEFRLLEGVSHSEAIRAIRDADVVIDNAISGDYEVVSIEAMAASRVAVANVGDESRSAFPDAPVYAIDPPSLVDRLRTLVEDVELRRSLATRGRAFVTATHDAPVVASRLVEFYERPARPVPVRAFPDWTSLESSRRIERLEAQLGDARLREAQLRRRLGLPIEAVDDRTPTERLPMPLRLALRRARARLRTGLRRR